MKNDEFRKWLGGFFELAPDAELNRKKLFIIRNHLNLARAVEGELDERNQQIYARVSAVLDSDPTPQTCAELNTGLRAMFNDKAATDAASPAPTARPAPQARQKATPSP